MHAFLVLFFLFFSLACGRDDLASLTREKSLRFASADEVARGSVMPHSYLVAFKGTGASAQAQFSQRMALSQVLARTGRAHAFFSRLNISRPGLSFLSSGGLDAHPFLNNELPDQFVQMSEVRFADEEEARRLLSQWHEDGLIAFAEPNYQQGLKGALEDDIVSTFQGAALPWLEQVSFVPAIQLMGTAGARANPLIAVMDSGVDVEHPNLSAAIFRNEIGQNKLCRNDLLGCNTTVSEKENLGNGDVFPPGTSRFSQACNGIEECPHGTHVAGLIAARDSTEMTGLCPYCQILVVKVTSLDKTGAYRIKDSSIIAGLSYISGFQDGGQPLVRVINASFGKFESSRSVELFVQALRERGRGTLMVAAAGNEDSMKREYPAAFEGVLSVSNVLSDSNSPRKSRSSSFGAWVDIAAPGDGECRKGDDFGVGLLSTTPGGNTDCLVGTSMATPVVAGIAGLLLAKEPELTASQVEARILNSAVSDAIYRQGINDSYLPTVKGGNKVPLLGRGVVNALFTLDPSQQTSTGLLSEDPDMVKGGCGLIGAAGFPLGSLFLFLPLLVLLRKRR